MNSKLATNISLITIVILGIIYLVSAIQLDNSNLYNSIGPGYFPKLLSIILILLCIVSFIQNLKKENKKIEIPNIKIILTTIGITSLYFISWFYLGFFYIQTFLYFFILINFYTLAGKRFNKKKALTNFLISLIFSIFIYVVFNMVIPIPIKF